MTRNHAQLSSSGLSGQVTNHLVSQSEESRFELRELLLKTVDPEVTLKSWTTLDVLSPSDLSHVSELMSGIVLSSLVLHTNSGCYITLSSSLHPNTGNYGTF